MEAQALVAWNLRRLRVAKDISQDDLALQAEVDRAYVGYVERAKRNPTVGTLEKLASALGVHISAFFVEPEAEELPPRPLKGGRRRR